MKQLIIVTSNLDQSNPLHCSSIVTKGVTGEITKEKLLTILDDHLRETYGEDFKPIDWNNKDEWNDEFDMYYQPNELRVAETNPNLEYPTSYLLKVIE